MNGLTRTLNKLIQNRSDPPPGSVPFQRFSPEQSAQLCEFLSQFAHIPPSTISQSFPLKQARFWKNAREITPSEKYFREQSIVNCLWAACCVLENEVWVSIEDDFSCPNHYTTKKYIEPLRCFELFEQELKSQGDKLLMRLQNSVSEYDNRLDIETLNNAFYSGKFSWADTSKILSSVMSGRLKAGVLKTEVDIFIQNCHKADHTPSPGKNAPPSQADFSRTLSEDDETDLEELLDIGFSTVISWFTSAQRKTGASASSVKKKPGST